MAMGRALLFFAVVAVASGLSFTGASSLNSGPSFDSRGSSSLNTSKCIADTVQQKWLSAHAGFANKRVDRELFISQFMKPAAPDVEVLQLSYLQSVFDVATAMMLPEVKMDLGKHCFSYAAILADEFYAADGSVPDKLGLMAGANLELDADWEAVAKDSEGRVTLPAFKTYYLAKYAPQLVGPEINEAFTIFLEKAFLSGRMMMLLPNTFAKATLGGHCFRYVGLMIGEFYFGGKAADNLNVVSSLAATTRWSQAHAAFLDARVNGDMFLAAFGEQLGDHHFQAYLEAVFETSTAMMLPKVKNDLGKHCFGYGVILADEFYTAEGFAADKLGLVSESNAAVCQTLQLQSVRAALDADFAAVSKDSEGRVTENSFVDFYMTKNAAKLPEPEDIEAYITFLHHCFFIGRAMMLKLPGKFQKNTLGGHCFRYSGLMAGEFYFGGSADDVLGLTF